MDVKMGGEAANSLALGTWQAQEGKKGRRESREESNTPKDFGVLNDFPAAAHNCLPCRRALFFPSAQSCHISWRARAALP